MHFRFYLGKLLQKDKDVVCKYSISVRDNNIHFIFNVYYAFHNHSNAKGP